MVPVFEGLCRYESLIDGTLDMTDIALMHDALNLRDDNDAAVRHWMDKHRV